GGIDAGHVGGRRLGPSDDIAVGVERELAREDAGDRRVADGDEDAVGRHDRALPGPGIDDAHAGDARRLPVADDLLDDAVPDDAYFGIGEKARLQDLFRAELVAAVDQGDAGSVVGEVERLLDRGVAAADHHDLAAAEEEAIAGGAGRDAEAAKFLLAGDAEPARLRAGTDDDRVGDIDVAGVADAG